MHQTKFPPENPGAVREIACDGNEKVLVKVCETDAPLKKAGRPPNGRSASPTAIASLWPRIHTREEY